jgi:hypothetical protein
MVQTFKSRLAMPTVTRDITVKNGLNFLNDVLAAYEKSGADRLSALSILISVFLLITTCRCSFIRSVSDARFIIVVDL